MRGQAIKKDMFREIRKSMNRFISLLLIAGMGSGFFIGVKTTAPSMRATADKLFNEQNLMDIELLSTVGFGIEDAEQVQGIEGVDKVMPSYSLDAMISMDSTGFVVHLAAIPEDESNWINKPILKEGRWPEAENECVTLSGNQIFGDADIGTKLHLEPTAGTTEVDTVLTGRDFTVVGQVYSPMYFSFSYGNTSVGSGSISMVIFVPERTFTYERYTEMYVTLKEEYKGESAYTEQYKQAVREVNDAIAPIGVQQVDSFVGDIHAQLTSATEQLDAESANAEQQLSEAKQQLDDARAELEAARIELAEGQKEFDDGYSQLRAEGDDGIKQTFRGVYQMASAKQQLAQGEEEYDKNYRETYALLVSSRAQLDEGRTQYEEGIKQYEEGEKGYASLEAGMKNYNSYAGQIQQAQKGVNDATTIVDSGDTVVSSARDIQNGTATDETYTNMSNAASNAVVAANSLKDNSVAMDALENSGINISTITGYISGSQDSSSGGDSGSGSGSGSETTEDQLAQAESALAEARGELNAAQAQINASKQQLATVASYMADDQKKFKELRQLLDDAQEQLTMAKEFLDDGEVSYIEGLATAKTEFAEARIKLDEGAKELAESSAPLDEGRRALYSALNENLSALISGQAELIDGAAEIEAGQKQYDAGMKQYNAAMSEAEKAINDGRARIATARESLSDIESGVWYEFGREDMVVYYRNYTQDTDRIDAIAKIFPVFFLLVAALVCLTTMRRMVEEHLTEMGTYKALGYSNRDISMKYIMYALIASIIGIVIGQVVCIQVLPQSIASAYSMMYNMPKLIRDIPWSMVAVSALASLASTVLVAWYTAREELQVRTATMMRPKAPKPGKQIFLEKLPLLWKHMNFSNKVTARNMFRYKVRLLMTVMGVGGCMALMVAGFGLQDAIMPLAEKQFSRISVYNGMAVMTAGYDEEDAWKLRDSMMSDSRVTAAMVLDQRTGSVKLSDTESLPDVYLYVPLNEDSLSSMVNLYEPGTDNLLTLKGDDIIITKKIAEKLNLNIGDSFVFTLEDKEYTLYVSGIVENYVYHYIYMCRDTFTKLFGKLPSYNSVLVRLTEETMADDGDRFVSDWLNKNKDFYMIQMITSSIASVRDLLSSLNMVVIIMIVCAGALAFVVVYNLTNINISEREREIATLKVLGFTNKEVNLYVFQEIAIMTFIGIVVGALGGTWLSSYMVKTVEVDMVMFIRKLDFSSYLYSAALTLVFTILVDIVMTRKMKHISMVEALKAIE